jgi:hypothetical protein
LVGIRTMGVFVVIVGGILAAMAFASTTVSADQLSDPFVGYFTKHTVRYFIIATACLCAGGIMALHGGSVAHAKPIR